MPSGKLSKEVEGEVRKGRAGVEKVLKEARRGLAKTLKEITATPGAKRRKPKAKAKPATKRRRPRKS